MDPAEPFSPFPPEQRAIFPYRDGRGPRRGDPMAIDARMLAALKDVDEEALDQHLRSEDVGVFYGAVSRVLPAIRAAFKVTAFEDDEEAGLTDDETFHLWADFRAWCDRLKGDTGPTPSTSRPTDDGPASSPTTSAGSASS